MFVVGSYIHFFVVSSFLVHNYIEHKWFLNRSILPKNYTLTGIKTPSQIEPWSYGSEAVLHTPQTSRTNQNHDQNHFRLIPRKHLLVEESCVPPLQAIQSVYFKLCRQGRLKYRIILTGISFFSKTYLESCRMDSCSNCSPWLYWCSYLGRGEWFLLKFNSHLWCIENEGDFFKMTFSMIQTS